MLTAVCSLCHRDFSNEHHYVGGCGDAVAFADYDDSMAKLGCVPGVTGVEWFCRVVYSPDDIFPEWVPAREAAAAATSRAVQ